MGNLVINTNKISTNVIPNIKNADTYIKNAKTYVTSMYGVLPKDFSSRSTALNIKTEIEYLSSDIEKMLSFFQSKVANIDDIDSKNYNRLHSFVDTVNDVNKTNKPKNDRVDVEDFSDYSDENLKNLIEACTEDIYRYKREGYSDKEKDSLTRRKKYEAELKKRGIFIADKDTMANQISGLKEDIKRYKSEGYYEKAATSERRLQGLEVIYGQLQTGNKIYYNYTDVLRDKLEEDVITTYDFEKYNNLDAGIYEAIALYPEACNDSLLTFKALKYTSQKEYEDLKAEKQGYIDMIWNNKFGCLDSTEDDLWWYYNREHPDNVPYFQLALLTFKGGHDSVIGSIEGQGVDPSSYQYKIGKYRKLIEFMTEEQINHYLELDYNDREAAEKYLVDIGVHTQFSYWEDKLLGKYKYTNEDFARIATNFENSEIERITGCSIEKVDDKIAELGSTVAFVDSISFEYESSRYIECVNNKDFDKYADASIFDGTFVKSKDIDDCSLDYSKIAYYMTDDERKSYAYQLGKYGKNYADKYLIFLKDELRSRCGLERAKDTLSKYVIKDENGNIKTTIVDGKEYPLYDVDNIFKQIGLFGTGAVDGVQTFGEGLLNIFSADGEKSSFDYEKMYIIMLLNSQTDNKIFTPSFGYELGSSVGNMLPPMLASAITTAITQNPALGAKLGRLLMGLSAYGNGKEELLQQDYDELTACFRSAIGALTEVGLETFLGSIPGISKMEGSEKWICKVLSEGTEESVQYVVDALFDTVILGEDFSLDFDELVKSGVMGMFSSGIINAPRSLYVTYKGVKTKIDVSKLSEIYKYDNSKLWNSEYNSQITESMIKYTKGDYEGAAKIMSDIGYDTIADNILTKSSSDTLNNSNSVNSESNVNNSAIKSDVKSAMFDSSKKSSNHPRIQEAVNMAKRVATGTGGFVGAITSISLATTGLPGLVFAMPILGKSLQVIENATMGNYIKNSNFGVKKGKNFYVDTDGIKYKVDSINQVGFDMTGLKGLSLPKECKSVYFMANALNAFQQLKVYDANGNNQVYQIDSHAMTKRAIGMAEKLGYIKIVQENNLGKKSFKVEKLLMGNLSVKDFFTPGKAQATKYQMLFELTGKKLTSEDLATIMGKDFSTYNAIFDVTTDSNNNMIAKLNSKKLSDYKTMKRKVTSLSKSQIVDVDNKNVIEDDTNSILKDTLVNESTDLHNNIKNDVNSNSHDFAEYNTQVSKIKSTLFGLSSKLVSMYEQGRATGKSLHDFLGYEEHNFLHVSRVATESVKVLNCLEKLINQGKINGYGKVDQNIVYESGLAHDLGMKSGGYMIDGDNLVHIDEYLSNLSSQEIINVGTQYRLNISDQPSVQEIENLRAAIIRKQHPLNSAIEVLKNRQIFSKNPELISCLAFIHSKSSSQVKNVSSIESLSAMVKKLYYNQVSGGYTFDISKLVVIDSNGEPLFDTSNNLVFKDDVLSQLKTGAIALRVGDAHAEKTGFNHGGGKINIKVFPNSVQTINNFLSFMSDRGNYNLDSPSINNEVNELCDMEASHSVINIEYEDGEIVALKGGNLDYSRRVVLGERNVINAETTVDKDGNLVYTFIVKSENSPACTWVHGIQEKFGEYETFKDVPQKVIIKLPNNVSTDLINFYKVVSDNCQASRNWLTIEIQAK